LSADRFFLGADFAAKVQIPPYWKVLFYSIECQIKATNLDFANAPFLNLDGLW